MPEPDLVPSLLAASDVLGTGWFAAEAAQAGPGRTVAVVGDGAVGLLGVLAAKQLGAGRIIAVSRHADRQALARGFGATDIVTERGDDGVARVKELTGGLGAHSVIEAVGTQEAVMQAIRSTRPGGHVGFVGVSHDVAIPGDELFMAGVHLHGGPPPSGSTCPSWSSSSGTARSTPAQSSTSPSRWPRRRRAARRWTSAPPRRSCSPSDRRPTGERMPMPRTLLAAALSAVVGLAGAGCGDTDADRPPAGASPTTGPPDPPNPTPTSHSPQDGHRRITITIGTQRFHATLSGQ
jgi:hypothetical protein